MKYMGSKARIAKHILPIILKNRKPEQWYVEPFVGGANMIDKVEGNRIGADINKYLIALMEYLQTDMEVPCYVGEFLYNNTRSNPEKYEEWYVGYVGFLFSFGAKFFGGFVGDSGSRDRIGESYRNALKTRSAIKGIKFLNEAYQNLQLPHNSIIYCDPPYAGTTKYKDDFVHAEFWQWCRDKVKEGHQVFISEYNAPDDFECIWSQELNVSVARSGKHKKAVERLFVHNSQK